MTRLATALALLALASSAVAQAILADDGPDELRLDMKSKVYRDWPLELPQETFRPVGDSLDFSAALGRRFAVTREGTALRVDVDGDGETDVVCKGESAVVTLQGTEGRRYAMRLRNGGGGWVWSAASVVTGKLGGTQIRIIDQDGNGRFDDFGSDAMIVGRRKIAAFLSRTVNVDGRLWDLDVAADGLTVTCTPHAGDSGTFKLAVNTEAKVLSAIIRSRDGELSFEVSKAHDGMLLPVADYTLHSGKLGLGDLRLKIRTGRSGDFSVAKDATAAVGWGGPVDAEFRYRRQGDAVELSPEQVFYFGRRGEEYYDWFPAGKSPKFIITNRKTGKEIALTYFPGSC